MAGIHVPGMKQRDDPLTTVMKGLSIAQSVFGIKDSMNKSDAAEKAADDKARGVITPAERVELQKTHREVPADTPNAVKMIGRDADGAEKDVFYEVINPKHAEVKTRQVETVGPDGKPRIDIVEDKPGTSYPAYQKPKEDKSSEQTMAVRKEYNDLQTTKATVQLNMAHQKVESGATNKNPSPATDMSLIYGYMKLLDPGNAVKEGEYATAEQARGVSDTVVNLYNRLKDGAKLTPDQRSQFLSESDAILGRQLSLQKEQDDRYDELSRSIGVNPKFVVDPSFEKARARLATPRQSAAPASAVSQQNINEIGLPPPGGTAKAAPQGGATPGSVIELKNHPGKRFVVGADGETLTEIK